MRHDSRPRPGDARRDPWLTSAPLSPVALISVLVVCLIGGIGTIVWRHSGAAQTEAAARGLVALDLVASLAAHEANAAIGEESPKAEHLRIALSHLPPVAVGQSRSFYLADTGGFIVAAEQGRGRPPGRTSELFATMPQADSPQAVAPAVLADGTPVIATIRRLAGGHLVVLQPWSSVIGERDLADRTISTLTGLSLSGLLLLAFGCAIHARRAHRTGLLTVRLRERLDSSLTQGRCGLWDWNLGQDRMTWSTSMYDLLGYEPRRHQLSLQEVGAILHPADRSLCTAVQAAARSGTGPIEQDVRALDASGQWRWLRLKVELAPDASNGDVHALGVAFDITDERDATEARAGADRRLADAVEALSEAFVLWDGEERLILSNSKFRHLHGIADHLATPGTSYAAIAAASREPIAAPRLARGALGSGTRTTDTQLEDGRWLHVSERRTRDGGVVSIGTDVSELKQNEARLIQRERDLKVSVKVARRNAQQLAELAEHHFEANQAKSQFMARMSHELRTPLTAIIGFAEMMRHEILGPLGCRRYTEYSRDIHDSGNKLLQVIEGVLQMSHLETGQVELAPELLSVSSLAASALETVATCARDKRLRVEVDVREPSLIYADERSVREILVQLLRNAAEFTQVGGAIRVRARPAGRFINLFVEDDGIGIPADAIPTLGKPYEQTESEYTRSGGGTGFGIAIARGFAELHGGRLRIRSQIGTGTVVMVTLPVVQAPRGLAVEPADESPAPPPRMKLVAAE